MYYQLHLHLHLIQNLYQPNSAQMDLLVLILLVLLRVYQWLLFVTQP
ncbi:hypothetical protein YPPY66_3607 [Yersinia pestis PY-66]|uniref:Uncharacterized protein n=1 Tax=Yersinia pestis PY-08 TaxID=992134 RepID=A0AB72ZHD6_YERPE|nr:hypothetical protein A1122_11740 [Yersinia pestis A1122]EIQ86557.1 hypothetical protein YPPY01_3258 [Yersinia pestis PY-01]EIQ87341.1 hypothetical protein YPPY02_3296 [Yersinia pestis PY-02]EIQ87746.1 hypothetical protein YPPY03_3363 [Yersinia pestis PY-03]EIQ99864.1 hypothetical protein YPPY04_3312 [Yersinia pestis PY-04]EIR00909.1 hypothetical protein YPPY05_3291 [Yersinia pestis PY-05]EIR04269.1 hypothetical protein YPPY06_3348 [Yersinia pestis PY-06]EIR15046.1 hypothetical protein YPP